MPPSTHGRTCGLQRQRRICSWSSTPPGATSMAVLADMAGSRQQLRLEQDVYNEDEHLEERLPRRSTSQAIARCFRIVEAPTVQSMLKKRFHAEEEESSESSRRSYKARQCGVLLASGNANARLSAAALHGSMPERGTRAEEQSKRWAMKLLPSSASCFCYEYFVRALAHPHQIFLMR